MAPWYPLRTRRGSRPMWSRCAWLTTIASIRLGSKGTLALSAAASARGPWKSRASRRIRAPAASRRCIEPVTWPAAPQNVSFAVPMEILAGLRQQSTVNSQPDLPRRRRSWFRRPFPLTPLRSRRSSCPEDPVPRIAQSGQNVTVGVELAVEGGGVDRHVGMGVEHRLDALRRRDQAEKPDPGGAGGAELAHGRGCRAAGREHRIEDEEIAVGLRGGDFEVVAHRLERVVVAEEPHVPDPGRRDELADPLDHAEAGPEDRHQGELLPGDSTGGGTLERRLDLHRLGLEMAGGLIGHQHRDLRDQLLEILDRRGLVPEDGELVLDQRVLEDGEVGEAGVGGGHGAGIYRVAVLRGFLRNAIWEPGTSAIPPPAAGPAAPAPPDPRPARDGRGPWSIVRLFSPGGDSHEDRITGRDRCGDGPAPRERGGHRRGAGLQGQGSDPEVRQADRDPRRPRAAAGLHPRPPALQPRLPGGADPDDRAAIELLRGRRARGGDAEHEAGAGAGQRGRDAAG